MRAERVSPRQVVEGSRRCSSGMCEDKTRNVLSLGALGGLVEGVCGVWVAQSSGRSRTKLCAGRLNIGWVTAVLVVLLGSTSTWGGTKQVAAQQQQQYSWVNSLPKQTEQSAHVESTATATPTTNPLLEEGTQETQQPQQRARRPRAPRPSWRRPATPTHDGAQAWARRRTTRAREVPTTSTSCSESGVPDRAGLCVCPALFGGPKCSASGVPVEPGTCACGPSIRPPNTQKYHARSADGVIDAIPSGAAADGIPTAYDGPVMLSREELRAVHADVPKGGKDAPLVSVRFPGKPSPLTLLTEEQYSPLLEALPEHDPLRRRHGAKAVHHTCAVVGNGGSLLLGQRGSEIDNHDFVIRFNGAPTLGFERFVGGRTDLRLSNSHWTDFEERLSHMPLIASSLRNPKEGRTYVQRYAAAKKAISRQLSRDLHRGGNEESLMAQADMELEQAIGQRALLSPRFVAYTAEAVEAMHLYFGEANEAPLTPTGGLTGILLAMSMCDKVDLYGMHVGEPSGVPYHYHNRCPQPFSGRDVSEYRIVSNLAKARLVTFKEPCAVECAMGINDTLAALGESNEVPVVFHACVKCRNDALSSADRSAGRVARMRWQAAPMPSYCDERSRELQKKKEMGECMGLCGHHFHWWDDVHVADDMHGKEGDDGGGGGGDVTSATTTTTAFTVHLPESGDKAISLSPSP
ncbi:glycosyltransferase family 29 [Pseudoscourfieldia marina]